MGNYKEHMNKHLVSAKEWVSRAEQSFETQKDIRGELDLFLAHAELSRAKEASRLHRLMQYPFFKQGIALVFAVGVVAFGLGVSYWFNAHLSTQPQGIIVTDKDLPGNYPLTRPNSGILKKEQPQAFVRSDNSLPYQNAQKLNIPDNIPDNMPGQLPVLDKEAPEKPATAVSEDFAPQPEHSFTPAPVTVSKEQMQNLIRSAGNSLRGRE